MKEISKERIVANIKELCVATNCGLGEDVVNCYHKMQQQETSPIGQEILKQIIRNIDVAKENQQPLCQDTGFAVFFVELGTEVHLDCDLQTAIDEGVRQGYKEGYLRKSIVADPFRRTNTTDNTPAIIHIKQVMGDKLKIALATKGGGAENMSRLKMLVPADGIEGVKKFVIETVELAGANPCPPVIVGVGIGGTFEKSALLAKHALFRKIGSTHEDPFYADLEQELLGKINQLGIGPMGLGGSSTALAVFVNVHPCHIASLPVSVNIQCHSSRHKEIIID